MKSLFTLLTILLINSGLATAQKSGTINLLFRPDVTISPKGCLFVIDSIIDMRLDSSKRIGTWQYPSGKTAEVHLKDGFQPALSNFMANSLTNSRSGLPAYTLTFQEFMVHGIPATTRFELAVTFSTHATTDQLGQTFKAEIIIENTTNTIAEILKLGIGKALLKFNEFLASPNTIAPIYSDFALEAAQAVKDLNLVRATYDSSRTKEDNLLACSQLRPGIYQSFSELRQNRPSLVGQLVIEERNDFASLRKSSGSRSKQNFFGFSDGKNLFISTKSYGGLSKRFAKVKSVGRYLLWIDNYVTSTEMAAGATFGVIGALAVASYKDCMVLDMKTGGVFMVTKDKLPQMLSGHDDLLNELAALPNPGNGQQQFRLLDKLNQLNRSTASY